MLWKKGQNFILLSDKNSLSSIYNTHLRFKNRKSWSLRVLTLVWLLIIGVWLYSVSSNFELDQLLRGQDGLFQALELANFNPLFSDYLRKLLPEPHKNFRSSENLIHSEIYDPIIKDYGLSTILNDLSFNERCELYFNELYKNEPNWKLDPYHRYNKDVEQMKSFSEFHLDHVLYDSRELGIDPSELHFSEAKEREIKQKYDKMHKKMRRDEQSLHTHLTHFKIFNKCFLTSNSGLVKSEIDTFVTSQKQSLKEMGIDSSQQELQEIGTLPKQNFSSCDDIERRVYPWLTGKLPKYIRWDGTIHDGSIPQICTYTGENCEELPVEAPIESMLTGNKQCFLNNMRTQLNGKGIALTIDDRHTEITIRLIRLLRYHGNRYPIQIVYILWVSEESRKQLIKASREMLTDQNGNELVQQELWFVDVSQSLHKKYYVKFRSFGNKILATLFNSFAELMLVDSDTVMLQSPDYFFNMPQYNEHGAFFYRDRSAQYRTKSDAMFFRKMMPSLLDTAIFDFPQVTNYTLDRELFNGLTHYMESGLVMVNRKRHFLQALTMAQISFMDPINKRVHGDKELFFLSLTIYGDEGYSFNKNFAASIGVETPIEERLVEVKKKSRNFKEIPKENRHRKVTPKLALDQRKFVLITQHILTMVIITLYSG